MTSSWWNTGCHGDGARSTGGLWPRFDLRPTALSIPLPPPIPGAGGLGVLGILRATHLHAQAFPFSRACKSIIFESAKRREYYNNLFLFCCCCCCKYCKNMAHGPRGKERVEQRCNECKKEHAVVVMKYILLSIQIQHNLMSMLLLFAWRLRCFPLFDRSLFANVT